MVLSIGAGGAFRACRRSLSIPFVAGFLMSARGRVHVLAAPPYVIAQVGIGFPAVMTPAAALSSPLGRAAPTTLRYQCQTDQTQYWWSTAFLLLRPRSSGYGFLSAGARPSAHRRAECLHSRPGQ